MATRVYSDIIILTIEPALPTVLTATWELPATPITGNFTAMLTVSQQITNIAVADFRLVPVGGSATTLGGTTSLVVDTTGLVYSLGVDVSGLGEVNADYILRFLEDSVNFQTTMTGPDADVDSDEFRLNTYVAAEWTGIITGTYNGLSVDNRVEDLYNISTGTDRTFAIGSPVPSQIRNARIENDDELVFDVSGVSANTNVQLPIVVSNPGGSNTISAMLTLVEAGAEALFTRADSTTALYTREDGAALYTRNG